MKTYKMIMLEQGNKTTEFEGTEKEVLNYWKKEKTNYLSFIGDNDESEKYEELTEREIKNIEDLQELFEDADYDWWRLEIE